MGLEISYEVYFFVELLMLYCNDAIEVSSRLKALNYKAIIKRYQADIKVTKLIKFEHPIKQ